MNFIENHMQEKANKRIIAHEAWQNYVIILGEM